MKRRKGNISSLSALSSLPSPCRSRDQAYQLTNVLGEGAQSLVYSAVCKQTGEPVAVKEIKNHRNVAYPVADYFREISILRYLPPHAALVNLLEVVASESKLLLIFELCEMNLREWLDKHGVLRGTALAGAARQLFTAVSHIHEHGVMHRDIKPQNFLIKDGRMKLADFGLAKRLPQLLWQEAPLTLQVASLWYRPPELMLGAQRYDDSMDIWACGCVLFEMATGQVLFQGESEIATVFKMFMRLGTPSSLDHLPHYSHRFPKWQAKAATANLSKELSHEQGCADLLLRCVEFKPSQRITARDAIATEWLTIVHEVADSPSPIGLF